MMEQTEREIDERRKGKMWWNKIDDKRRWRQKKMEEEDEEGTVSG